MRYSTAHLCSVMSCLSGCQGSTGTPPTERIVRSMGCRLLIRRCSATNLASPDLRHAQLRTASSLSAEPGAVARVFSRSGSATVYG
jgi:hypothetical protein